MVYRARRMRDAPICNRSEQAAPRLRSSATNEQLLEYFEVRFRAEKYAVAYFLAESEAKQSKAKRPTERGRRSKSAGTAVEDLNGGYRREALGVGRLSRRRYFAPEGSADSV